MDQAIVLRLTGFIASLILSLAAYFTILNPTFFGSDIYMAITVLFIFALVQATVQLIFFIDVWKEKGALWNFGVFISTVSIIFIVVYFSIWIMNHLNYNMQ